MAKEGQKKRVVGYLRLLFSLTQQLFKDSVSFKELKESLDNKSFLDDINIEFNNDDNCDKLDQIIQIEETILSIVRSPLFIMDKEDVVKRSELVSEIETDSYIETLKDSKVWKKKFGEMYPEYIHTKEVNDSLITYENRFICMLIDLIAEEIDDFSLFQNTYFLPLIQTYETDSLTFSSNSFLNDFKPFTIQKNYDFFNERKPSEEFVSKINLVNKYMRYIKGSVFYKTVSLHRITSSIVPTNILVHNNLYSRCYKYYKNNYFENESKDFLGNTYFNYVILKLIETLVNKKIKISTSKFYLNDLGKICFVPFEFTYNHVKFFFSEIDSMNIEVKVSYKGETSTSLIVIDRILTIKDRKVIEDTYKNYANVIFITALNKSNIFDKTLICSYYDEKKNDFINLFTSLFFVIKVKEKFNKCPLCGYLNSGVNDSLKFTCSSCKASYRFFEVKDGYELWICSYIKRGD